MFRTSLNPQKKVPGLLPPPLNPLHSRSWKECRNVLYQQNKELPLPVSRVFPLCPVSFQEHRSHLEASLPKQSPAFGCYRVAEGGTTADSSDLLQDRILGVDLFLLVPERNASQIPLQLEISNDKAALLTASKLLSQAFTTFHFLLHVSKYNNQNQPLQPLRAINPCILQDEGFRNNSPTSSLRISLSFFALQKAAVKTPQKGKTNFFWIRCSTTSYSNLTKSIIASQICQAANFKYSFSSSANADCFWYLRHTFTNQQLSSMWIKPRKWGEKLNSSVPIHLIQGELRGLCPPAHGRTPHKGTWVARIAGKGSYLFSSFVSTWLLLALLTSNF